MAELTDSQITEKQGVKTRRRGGQHSSGKGWPKHLAQDPVSSFCSSWVKMKQTRVPICYSHLPSGWGVFSMYGWC